MSQIGWRKIAARLRRFKVVRIDISGAGVTAGDCENVYKKRYGVILRKARYDP